MVQLLKQLQIVEFFKDILETGHLSEQPRSVIDIFDPRRLVCQWLPYEVLLVFDERVGVPWMFRLSKSVISIWQLVVETVMTKTNRLHHLVVVMLTIFARLGKECCLFSLHNAVGAIYVRCSQIVGNNLRWRHWFGSCSHLVLIDGKHVVEWLVGRRYVTFRRWSISWVDGTHPSLH